MALTAVGGSFGHQARIIFVCVRRIVHLKSRDTPLGVLSNLIEPMATIAMLTLVFTTVKLRVPMLGDYVMLFLMTGILPISMFRNGAQQSEGAVRQLKRNLVLPQIKPLDLMISGVITSMLTISTLFLFVTILFWLVYNVEWPQNIVFCAIPAVCNGLIGLGFGCINLVIKSWFLYWGTIFGIVTAPIGLLSGMFYTVDRFPQKIQDILYYNPFMHSTELTRTFFYKEYTSEFFDPLYYYGWTFTALAVGLVCERVFRYRLAMDRK
ncbi:MAG: ABC transporter permease [Pseudomonadota bacterium]